MNRQELFTAIKTRLTEFARPDRGWFLTTRVHLSIEVLSKIATYIHMVGIGEGRPITVDDYHAIAASAAVGKTADDPGMILRRHQLLAMKNPLLLLAMDTRQWSSVRLTDLGRQLATEADKHGVVERSLAEIVFCREPWYTAKRVAEYPEFDIRPYPAVIQILEGSGSFIDNDEYGAFVYNLRNAAEIPWSIDMIAEYRALSPDDRVRFMTDYQELIRNAVGAKTYQNWRDMALHAFSVFSLGSSCVREATQLLLTGNYTNAPPLPIGQAAAHPAQRTLNLVPPGVPTGNSLAVPPPITENSGSEGEQFIAKILQAQGWEVVFYTDKRGYGFDLWAKRGDVSILIEVKSSMGVFGALKLTEYEYLAAQTYGQSFIVAIVEQLADTPRVYYIADPIQSITLAATNVSHYQCTRANWSGVAADVLTVQGI
ncbi:MAG: DUF3883 domain-containing protein [Candidatus Obscuribacterales bacterium]|nr:DUF3883 domain-containing protein [Candidatus Obscuribacterales bacterium]